MSKYLVVRNSDGLVVNAIIWDGESDYTVEGHSIFPLTSAPTGAWTGWHLINGDWVAPPENSEE